MLTILAIIICGIITGYLFQSKLRFLMVVERLTGYAIYLLLFLLGLAVGGNEKIISNLADIGFNAIILSISGITGSIVLAPLINKIYFSRD